jgi:dienelactone hydrolase
MGIEPYAKEFAKAGWACMVFDYRRWGASGRYFQCSCTQTLPDDPTLTLDLTDGFPRNILFVTDQLEDYRTVIQYCKKQPTFDPHRVVVWGTSFAGRSII